MQVISLFSGIGGFELAAQWMGWDNVLSCEINPFGRKVLEHYWPDSYHHDNVKTLNRETILKNSRWNPAADTVVCGGFPCQPYSAAGKRLGTEDDRHLWPEMLRTIREIQPTWVVGENVRGLTNWNGGMVFDQVQADLENEGYEVTPFLLPACAVNAPHRRDRIWFVAYSETNRQQRSKGTDRRQECEPNNRDTIRATFNTIGQIRATSDSDNSGAGFDVRTHGNGQEENQRWEGQSQSEFGPDGSVTSDTTNTRIEGMRPERENEIHGSGIVTDTKSESSKWVRSEQCEYSEQEQRKFGRNCSEMGNTRNVADTDGIRLRGESDGIGKSGFFSQESQRNYWANFPTQSPVCSRNDGISSRLVGITFSKHRQESIKAYGNAVVPQLVLQIFKAIEKYNNL